MRTVRCTRGMGHRVRRYAAPLVFLLAAVACGSQAMTLSSSSSGTTPGTAPASVDTDPDAPVALVITHAGLAGVPLGSNRARWVRPGAVAAPDGSAIYVAENTGTTVVTTQIWRIDPRTGAQTDAGRWVVPGGHPVNVFAVEPGGGAHVALASFEGDRTLILPFAAATGAPTAKPFFDGHLEPEAFSVDRQRIFAARSFGDHYRVTTLDLAAGEQGATGSYDKTAPPEDMYGNVIQSVLTPDHTRLATLYRDPHSTDHTAFVHLLDLRMGVTVCIDLPAPFATGAPGSDAIKANADGTISVGHSESASTAGVTVSIDPGTIFAGDPRRHYHVLPQADANPPVLPDGIASTPEFERFVAFAT